MLHFNTNTLRCSRGGVLRKEQIPTKHRSLPGPPENAIPKRNPGASRDTLSRVLLQLCFRCNSLKDMRTEFIEVQRLALGSRITSSVPRPSTARSLLVLREESGCCPLACSCCGVDPDTRT